MKSWKNFRIICAIFFYIFFLFGCGGTGHEVSSSNRISTTYYVNVNTGNNSYNGNSPAYPWKTLTHAITHCETGDTIWVAEGTYSRSTGETFPIEPKSGLRIIGGYSSNFNYHNSTNYQTIISPRDASYPSVTYMGVHFYQCNSNTLFKGFIIENCVVSTTNGGGIAIDTNSSPIIEDCTIRSNYSEKSDSEGGGGVYISSSSPTFTSCTISNNTAKNYGGGIFATSTSNPTFSGCTITGNTAQTYDGGGIYITSSSPTFTNCTISNNTAKNYGGGIFATSTSNPTFNGCTITGNTAQTYDGGGIYISQSSFNILNCTISINTAEQKGGGVHITTVNPVTNPCSPHLYNCTIFNNTANQSGGGIYVVKATPLIDYCRLYGNSAPEGGAMAFERAAGSTNETAAYYNNSYLGGGVYTSTRTDVVAQNCLFYDNSATYGGAIACRQSSYPLIANCTIYSNDTTASGGAFYAKNNSAPFIASSITTSNYASASGGGIYVKNDGSAISIVYSDLWGNTIAGMTQDAYREGTGGTQGMTEEQILLTMANWGWDATGCLSQDPKFVAPTSLNFHLQDISPCIDCGDPAYIGNLIDGNWEAVQGTADVGTVDMGFHYKI